MKNLVVRNIVFAFLCVALLFMIGKGFDMLSRRNFYSHVWSDIYDSRINADMVFLGSSRTHVGISPRILDSVLGIKTYNLGLEGWDFSMQYVRFKILISHNRMPKYIVQNIDFTTFEKRNDLFTREQFLPFLDDSILYNGCKGFEGEFTWKDKYLPMYKYMNHADVLIMSLTGFLKNHKQAKQDAAKGSELVDERWTSSFSDFQKKYPDGIHRTIDSAVLQNFEKYIRLCKKDNISLIFDFAPIYYEELPMEKDSAILMNVYRRLSAEYGIPILDYRQDTLCFNTKYFYNSQHLNKTGAEIFSRHLGEDLKKLISVPN